VVVEDDGGASGRTSGRMTGRIEVVSRVSGRRKWTVAQKLAMLRDAFGAGGSVRGAIERHEISSGLLYTWRRHAMSGELTGAVAPALPYFAEVRVEEAVPLAIAPPVSPVAPGAEQAIGRIGIELPSGIRLSVDAAVDAAALARVLSVLA